MKNIENIPIVVLSTFGHCGVDWLGNLFDSHKQILTTPALSFFRIFNKLQNRNQILLNDNQLVNFCIEKILQKSNFHSYNFFFKKEEKKIFKRYLKFFFIQSKEKNIIRKIFFGINFAYAKLKKIDLSKKKLIITHEHAAWHCEEYKKHFNVKYVFMLRDPRASFAGSFRTFERYKSLSDNYKLNTVLSFWISAEKFIKSNFKKNVYIVKNEKINNNKKKEIKKICKWLKIKYNQILLKPTFLGKNWHGDSSYLGKFELKKALPKNYYSRANVQQRWIRYLNKKSILLIETLLEKTMIQYGYKFTNKLTLSKKILGYIYLFTLYQNKNSLPLKPLYLMKSAVRRFLLIKFEYYVK